MAKRRLAMRVGALGLMGGAGILFAAQAGVLPGLGGGDAATPLAMSAAPMPPAAETPAALAGVLQRPQADAEPAAAPAVAQDDLVPAQALALPDGAGFAGAAPVISADAGPSPIIQDTLRPAAFAPAAGLPLPETPVPADASADLQGEALSAFGMPCDLDVSADAGPVAMIALGIAAPCHPDAEVTIAHSGLTIRLRTDAVGLLMLDLPALESPAMVTVTLADDQTAEAVVEVPDIASVDRLALTWDGPLALELHAMEPGATWNSDGHLHSGAPRDPAAGAAFLTLLGMDGPGAAPQVQVLTAPQGALSAGGSLSVSVDAPVTAETCTRTAEARLLRSEGGAPLDVTPLGFTYPGCSAVGEILVLQNLRPDPRLAAN